MTQFISVRTMPSAESRLIAGVCAAHLMSHYYLLMLAPLLAFVRADFNVSYTELALALTVFNVVSGVLQTPVGFLVDRIGARVVLIVGLALSSAAFAIAGVFNSYWVFIAMYGVAGLGNTAYHPADYSLLSHHSPPERLSHIFAFHTFAGMLGSAIAPVTLLAMQSFFGWREAFNAPAAAVQKLDTHGLPPQAFLGFAGMPGLTAYVGLLRIAELKAGDVVFVSGAAGAVGSVACQIAKLKGHTVIGSAGGSQKAGFLREIGVDHAIDYKAERDLTAALMRAAPEGIDVYFENVGGAVFAAVLRLLNTFARIPLCGTISDYNATQNTGGPNLRPLLVNRATIRGFIISDHTDRLPAFLKAMVPLVRNGRVKYREDVVDGLDAAPAALIGLFEGKNFGKMMVRVAPE